MSTIGVKYHNEDIHNIIPKPMEPRAKSPRYKSKRKFKCEEFAKSKYNGHQTFGLAHYEAPQSWNYLKKERPMIKNLPTKVIDKKEFTNSIKCQSSAEPKSRVENLKKVHKNYVKENIKKLGNIKPKIPRPRRVETPRGTVKDLAHLLQMIKIRQSEEYGRIPKYLCERRKQWANEKKKKEEEEVAVEEYRKKMGIGTMGMGDNVYMVDEETRQKLLNGLKENWNELSKQFLKLPVMCDTLPKIKRKMWLEKEIDQIEKDVKFVESHPYIYIERFDTRSYKEIVAEEIKNNEKEREKNRGKEKINSTSQEAEKNAEEKKKEEEENNIASN